MNEDLAKTIVNLTGNDKKYLFINDRYYCQLCHEKSLANDKLDSTFFTEPQKDVNSPSIFQTAIIYVLDVNVEKGHHKSGFGTISYAYHPDMKTKIYQHTITLFLPDNTMTQAISIEVVDMPYDIKEFMKLIDAKPTYPIYDPIEFLEGIEYISLYEKNNVSMSIEYDINGNIYCEIVDFKNVEKFGIVPVNSDKRTIVIDYQKLTNDNAKDFAKLINDAYAKLNK